MTKTRVGKVYPRFAKNGSAETQALVKRIDGAVEEFMKKKKKLETPASAPIKNETTDKDAKDAKSLAKPAIARSVSSDPVAGVKRAAPPNSINSQPPKRVASGPNGPASSASSLTSSKIAPNGKRTASTPASGNSPSAVTSNLPKLKSVTPKGAGGLPNAGVRKPVTTKVVASSAVANAM